MSASRSPRGVAWVDTAEALDVIGRPDCSAAIWNRPLPGAIRSWLDALDPATLPRGRVTLPVQAVAETVTHLCDMAGIPQSAERAWLTADIASLAETFASRMDAAFLRLRLDREQTDGGRMAQPDPVTARLLCTYRGRGTQYGIAPEGGQPPRMATVPTGAAVVFRGALWPQPGAPALLLRPPPDDATSAARLVLTLDPVLPVLPEMAATALQRPRRLH